MERARIQTDIIYEFTDQSISFSDELTVVPWRLKQPQISETQKTNNKKSDVKTFG